MSRISPLLSAFALTAALALPAASAAASDAPLSAPAPAPTKAVEKHSCVWLLGKFWCKYDLVSAGDEDCDPATMSCQPEDQVCTEKATTCSQAAEPRPQLAIKQ